VKVYEDWYDMSGRGPTLDDLYNLNPDLVGIQIELTHEEILDDATIASFNQQKATFICANDRDVHYDFSEACTTPGFQSRFLLLDKERRPWWLRCRFYLVSVLFLGVWCFRKKMQTKIARADCVLRTRVSVNVLDQPAEVMDLSQPAEVMDLSVSVEGDIDDPEATIVFN
jgi:hypothetical protein